jgi:hypothetical protein
MEINATLHCHGPWTVFESGKFDIEKFPRNLEKVADLAISKNLDLVGLTDIAGKEYVCEIYGPLVKGLKQDRYEIINQTNISISLMKKEDGRKIDFGRTLEVLSNDAHVLLLGTDKNILGGRPLEQVVYDGKEVGAINIADHPCYTLKLGKGMGEDRVKIFHEMGLIDAVEENGNIALFLEFIGNYNKRAINLGEELNLPVIANCDGNTSKDMGCMYTTYMTLENPIDKYKHVLDIISSATFFSKTIYRKGNVKPFISLPLHVLRGFYSIGRSKIGLLEKAIPTC